MDAKAIELAKGLVEPNYVEAGREALQANDRAIRSLLAQRKLPEEGLSDVVIENFITQLSMMDSNNNPQHCGAGEREGRVISRLVKQRHFGMTHGIGRSGDLSADQPKAGGSSIMYKCTNFMVKHALQLAGTSAVEEALVVPMATGMTLSLVLRSVASSRPSTAKYVVWPRIDQKTCLKCIGAAGFVAAPVELRKFQKRSASSTRAETTTQSVPAEGSTTDAPKEEGAHDPATSTDDDGGVFFLQSHPDDLKAKIEELGGADNILCVLSTTSCFAPRLPDDVLSIGRLCFATGIPHIVNNAYGVQSRPIMKRLNTAMDSKGCKSRVDAFVQSGDKNFLVPVGGAVVAGSSKVVKAAAALYAGRASAAPITDLFITMLSLGQKGWNNLLEERYQILDYFTHQVKQLVADPLGERVVIQKGGGTTTIAGGSGGGRGGGPSPPNDISFMMTLNCLVESGQVLELGARLFHHCVTGPRVVAPSLSTKDDGSKTIAGIKFPLYGSHCSEPNQPVLVMACGIGMTKGEVDTFVTRLGESIKELQKKTAKKKEETKKK